MNPFTDAAPRNTVINVSTWHPSHHLQSVASCSSLSSLVDIDHDKRPEVYQSQQHNAATMLRSTSYPPNANLRGYTDAPEKVLSCFVKHIQTDKWHRSDTSTSKSKFIKKSIIGQGQGQDQGQEALPSLKSEAAIISGSQLILQQTSSEQPLSQSQLSPQPRRVSGTNGVVSRLHRLCCRKSATVSEVKVILADDPAAIRRRVAVRILNQASEYKTSHAHARGHRQLQREPLTYPLNLAIHHKVSSDVILFLLDADPTVCLKPDGCMLESSLHILLRIGQRNDLFRLVDSFLKANPACAWTIDGRNQVPLHVTVAFGTELNVVRRLCTACPQALQFRNRDGHTVVDMAGHRHSTCTNAVAEYLWQLITLVQENETRELDDSMLFP